MNNDLETMKASTFEIGNKLDQLETHILEMEGNDELPSHAYVNDVTLESRKIFNDKDDVNPSSDHVSLSAFHTLESLETLEKHGNFNEIDDLSIFLDFITSINEEHALVGNVGIHEQHALDNDFASSIEHDLGRNININDEHFFIGIDIENNLHTNLIEIVSKLDDEKHLENDIGTFDELALDFDFEF